MTDEDMRTGKKLVRPCRLPKRLLLLRAQYGACFACVVALYPAFTRRAAFFAVDKRIISQCVRRASRESPEVIRRRAD